MVTCQSINWWLWAAGLSSTPWIWCPPQWGQRGSHFGHPTAYDYQHRGPYPSHNQPYPPAPYRNYPQHMAPRSGYGSGWEQRPHRAILEDPLCGGDNISLGKVSYVTCISKKSDDNGMLD
ncbi:uncharacterized protein LOC127748538 [Arachis duranensis]|uniref:Uncharacterized protein LOC127748538 n=1 Tax=Arachis duranensis TaxID=130453 RepID=A0A9C6TXS0_ARADU|nr:uncharacterized protein LOC127748538 [Arachis duranensis]